jgi:ArsR family transcriptional regulator, arsenate/arsenite/antimonite-responsive transcriptional repressor
MIDAEQAATGFSALGNPARLKIFRILVTAGHGGLPVGYIQEQLDIPLSTLAHHLSMLVKAGLVAQQKRGRQVICHANFGAMDLLIGYLTENCCVGVASGEDCVCGPGETKAGEVPA